MAVVRVGRVARFYAASTGAKPILRSITLLASLSFVTVASAQITGIRPPVIPYAVQDACNTLRTSQSMSIGLDGTDSRNGMRYHTDVVWGDVMLGTREYAQLRVDEYADKISLPAANTLVRQVVGDSKNLWNYDVTRREYSASQYGSESGKQPKDYRDLFLLSASTVSQGQTVNALRFLREVYAGTTANMSVWLPSNPQILPITDPNKPAITDPVVASRSYKATADRNFYLVYYPSGYQRSLSIELSNVPFPGPSDSPRWIVTAIYSADNTGRGLQDWTMTITPNISAGSSTFTFVPPTNARGISKSGS